MSFKRTHRLTRKQLIGIVIAVIGICLLGFCIHAKHQQSEAESLNESVSNFFEHNPTWNPIIKFFGGKAQEKIDSYNTPILILTIAGIVLIGLGGAMTYIYRNRSNLGEKK